MPVLYANRASSTLASSITNSATSLSVAAGQGARFPAITAPDYFYATLDDSAGNIEIVKVTARSTDTFTIVRGQDGTSALAFSSGVTVELRVVKAMLDDIKTDLFASDVTITGTSRLALGGSQTAGVSARIGRNITGATASSGVRSDGVIQSDVTSSVSLYLTSANTQAATFTLPILYHYRAFQGTFGAGSTVTSQVGFAVESSFVGATVNTGFLGSIPAGTNRWNLYMDGTASNYLAGATIINNALGFGAAGSPSYGTSGQFLKSAGSGAAPTWASLASSDVTGALGFTPLSTAGGTMTGAIQGTGFINSWGVTNGTATGALNVVHGLSNSATWLLSSTVSGVFAYGIQGQDSSTGATPSLRFYDQTRYFSFGNNILTANSLAALSILAIYDAGDLRLYDTDRSNYVGFKSPGTVSTNKVWTLPATDGTSGQVLATDGVANLSWASNVATATALQNTRTLWGQNFNGSANVSGDLTSVGNITGTGNVSMSGVFYENGQTVSANYTVTSGRNAMSAGPITIASGITVTVSSGSTWVIV